MTTLKEILERGKAAQPEDSLYENNSYPEEGIIYEAGLSRVLQHAKEPFAILTAFRNEYTLSQNRKRNRDLERSLKEKKAGGIKLTGYWQEAPSGMSWQEAVKAGKTKEVVEESYFVPKPKDMDYEEFEKWILQLVKKFDQDGAVIGDGQNTYYLLKDGTKSRIGSKITFDKMSQAYSRIRGKKVPFVFEGTIQPSNVTHRMIMNARGLMWFSEDEMNEDLE